MERAIPAIPYFFYLYKHGTAYGGWTTVSNHLAVRLRSFNHSKAPIVFGTATPVSYDFWAIGSASRFVKKLAKGNFETSLRKARKRIAQTCYANRLLACCKSSPILMPVNCVSGTDCCSGSQADFSCRIWATTTFWTSTDFFELSLFFYGSTVSRCSKPLESFESLPGFIFIARVVGCI